MITLVLLVMALSLLSSTPAQRAEARARIARLNPIFIGATIAVWTFILCNP